MSDSYFKSGVFQTELPMFFSPKTYCSFNLSILINNYFILLVAEVKKSVFFLFLLQPISNLSRNLIGCTFTYNYNPINLYSFSLHILYVFTQMSLSQWKSRQIPWTITPTCNHMYTISCSVFFFLALIFNIVYILLMYLLYFP